MRVSVVSIELYLEEAKLGLGGFGFFLEPPRGIQEVRGKISAGIHPRQERKHHLEDGDALAGVGAAAELVENHEAARLKLFEELAHAHELGAEPALFMVRRSAFDE
jgi:hypothetical protein